MGSGASAAAAAAKASSQEELADFVSGLGAEDRAKIELAIAAAGGAGAAAEKGAVAAAASAEAGSAEARASQEEGSGAATAEEVRVELGFVVEELFRCNDTDQDGMVGKDEYLECCEKLAGILDESFGPKQRRQKMQWYKDAGAEGDPVQGMFLSKEKWREALLKIAAEQSGISPEEPGKLAAWLWTSYAKQLVELCFPAPKPEADAGVPDAPAGPAPSYPLTIPLTSLQEKLDEAKLWGKRALVLASHCTEVGTYLSYQIPESRTIDSAVAFLKKKSEIKSVLCSAMEYQKLQSVLLLKMGSGSFDWAKFCCEEFPAEVFSAALWTPAAACEGGFISEGMKSILAAAPEKWKDFNIIITSDFDLDEATAKLADKIPHYEKLAILVVDPASIAKG